MTANDVLAPIRERLLKVAQEVAAERGWPWLEPVEIDLESSEGGRHWAIKTNCFARGRNIRVVVREADFAITSAGFLPR